MRRLSARSATVIRWTARVLGTLIVGFWGFFILAHLLGDAEGGSHPLNWKDYATFAAMGTWLSGLLVAWKWEILGGTVALASVLAAATIHHAVLTFPFTLIPIAASLFVLSGWMHRGLRDGWMQDPFDTR